MLRETSFVGDSTPEHSPDSMLVFEVFNASTNLIARMLQGPIYRIVLDSEVIGESSWRKAWIRARKLKLIHKTHRSFNRGSFNYIDALDSETEEIYFRAEQTPIEVENRSSVIGLESAKYNQTGTRRLFIDQLTGAVLASWIPCWRDSDTRQKILAHIHVEKSLTEVQQENLVLALLYCRHAVTE